ncbi:hypothetical protein B9Z55_007521 [Caenorhabditis nigoni]|uniref:Uncharacterized protein n=1 Tax=Caenorhabditis nigoni TaxID=1611254 RepID=A0A2G5VAN1_9PELO|nr:hypothetical protein B9Z55_007521 [Caenorhabditis nigoni]
MPPRKENAKKTFTESQRARKNAYEQARKAKKNGPMEELRALTRHRFSSDFQPEGAVIVEAANYIDELRRMLAEKEAAQKTNQIEMEEFDPEKAAYEMFGMSQPSSNAQSVTQPAVVVSNSSTSSEASYSQWNGYQEPQHEMFEPSPPSTIARSEMLGMSQPSSTAQSASPLAMVVSNTTATSSEAAYNQWNGYQEQYRMSPPWSIAESVTPPAVFVPNMSPDGVYNGSASPPSSIVSNGSTSSEAVYNQWNGYQEPQQYYYPESQVNPQQQYNEYLMNGGQYY